jgi:hypothetical protein
VEAVRGLLVNDLRVFEQRLRQGADAATLRALWQSIARRYRAGSANAHEAVPSDLGDLQAWTGFAVDLDAIEALYRAGECIPVPAPGAIFD